MPIVYDFWISDHFVLGMLVEFLGNEQTIEGCKFDLSSPLISTAIKSRFLLKRYEREEREAVKRYFKADISVVEMGGSIGVVSCVLNKKLAKKTKHIVIEANPKLIQIIKQNKELNNSRFWILNKVLAYKRTLSPFYLHEKFVGGSVQRKTNEVVHVKTTTLKQILKKYQLKMVNLVCDIEGGEADLIRNELAVLKRQVGYFIVEIHPAIIGQKLANQIVKLLKQANFEKVFLKRQVYVFKNNNLMV